MKACIDIGGTKVAVTLARTCFDKGHETDRLLSQTRLVEPTATCGSSDALAAQVLRMIDQAYEHAELQGERLSPLTAVGVSSCGPFVRNNGDIELAAPNICGGLAGAGRGLPNDWLTAPLEAPLRKGLLSRTPIGSSPPALRIENDGIAALEAERTWGALRGIDDCAYVTWSTGIGVGLCVGGQVLRGKNGNAGHAGHTVVSDGMDHSLCGCGNVDDVESIVGGNAIERRWSGGAQSLLSNVAEGDAHAIAKVDDICRVMGRMLYNLVLTLDLTAISLGGSVFYHHQSLLLPRLRAEVEGKFTALTRGVVLVPAGLGDRLGDHAALALVRNQATTV